MALEQKIRRKLEELIASSETLKTGNLYGQILEPQHGHSCRGWLASAQNLVHLVLEASNPYRNYVDQICSNDRGFVIHKSVGDVASILESLLSDIENGLISSIEDQTKAIVFDDFLDHAKEYVNRNSKNESGVISGVVFEDTLRTICRNHGIEEKGNQLDYLISELSRIGVLNQLKAKRARVAAHVRTKATHAQWNEFDMSDVKSVIEFTENLIVDNLAD